MVIPQAGVAQKAPDDAWIVVGKVLAPVGVRGEVKVEVQSDISHRYSPGAVLYVDGSPFQVAHCHATARVMVVKFRGVDSRDAAEALRGKTLWVPQHDVPTLPEDTYYHYEVLGMRVVTVDGDEMGTVTEIVVTGANDVYVVSGERGETLVPALADVVVAVDVPSGYLTVDLPETL